MGCNCGSKKGVNRTWEHISSTGSLIKEYTAEWEARAAAARQPGTRVREKRD